jgi:CDGSH iron-sulfur domain-containing protein 3
MSKVTIKVLDNGPYIISGDVDILDGADKPIDKPEEYALCRCGLSTNMPFCTGTHEGKLKNVVRKK